MLSLEQSTSEFTSNDLPKDFISSQRIHPQKDDSVGSGIALLTSHTSSTATLLCASGYYK